MFSKLLFIGVVLLSFVMMHVTSTHIEHSTWDPTDDHEAGSCGLNSCSSTGASTDPVNLPDYNMINVIKQSILLEEHLAEQNKYCVSCIIKHFLHIIGLCEEAIWLAGEDVNTYPFLLESPTFYQSEFDRWLVDKRSDSVKRSVFSELRGRRRDLIKAYFLSDEEGANDDNMPRK